MVIGIDVRFLAEGKRTGVEEYALNLFRGIFKIGQEHEFRLFANYLRGSSKLVSSLGAYPNVTVYRFRHSNKLLNLSFKYLRKPQIDELIGNCDVFFYPNIIFGSTSSNCPVVSTFHDLSFELHPEFLSLKKRMWHRLVNPRQCAQQATRIIAVSNSTKNDLIWRYNIPAGKIKVVPSGIELPPKDLDDKLSEVKKKYQLPEKFILFFGTLEPRKNAVGALKAFENIKKNGKIKQKLVIAGSPGWLDESFWREVAKSPFRRDIISTGFVEQADKLAVFSLADIFLFPSFYEGFGFPPLEAMAVGTPVITSSVSSLPEVVGDAALLVNPYNVTEISVALKKVLSDSEIRQELIRRGWKRVHDFTWHDCATKTLAVLEEAARAGSKNRK